MTTLLDCILEAAVLLTPLYYLMYVAFMHLFDAVYEWYKGGFDGHNNLR